MGDHFVLLMDRLLTESTLVAAIESRNRFLQTMTSVKDATSSDVVSSSHKIDFGNILNHPAKMVECRICQDEDEDRNMETPCSCCGSLKYAHRQCIQRWCNEKGDTKCEICHQQFRPGYTAPPPLFQIGRSPMSFRGNWEVYRRETPNGPRLITMISTDRDYSEPELDEHSTSRSVLCFRFVALIVISPNFASFSIKSSYFFSSEFIGFFNAVHDSFDFEAYSSVPSNQHDQRVLLRTAHAVSYSNRCDYITDIHRHKSSIFGSSSPPAPTGATYELIIRFVIG